MTQSPDRSLLRDLALGFVLATAACTGGDSAPPAHDEHEPDEASATFSVDAFRRFGVTVATAGPGEVDPGIELPGEVRPDPELLAHVAPRFPGIVREARVRAGDTVAAGQVLAIVESETLAPFEIRAAFAGTVIDGHVAPGEAVSRDRPIFVVGDLSRVWVDVSVYESALPSVRVGQPVVVTAASGALEVRSSVEYLAPVVDQATRTARARVVLPNPDGRWRPGMFVTATILDPSPASVVVPRRAVQRFDDRTVVFVVDGTRFAPRPVVLGRTGRTLVEVAEGLAPGETFADERSFLVKAELAKPAGGHDH
jgi:cobalt-zinc-cadmium efflux system membrane fusion protein